MNFNFKGDVQKDVISVRVEARDNYKESPSVTMSL